GYILDKPLPTALPEGSSPKERLTIEKWHEENRKVRSIILALMTNEIQKQYNRLEDVPSIMLHMKDVYAVTDRHIRYAVTKAFFGTKMVKGSSVHSHGVKMLSFVEKLEDLKAGLNNDTYIDVILQSLPPSYDSFIVNYNMNGLEKSIHELINMLVQYEATTHRFEPAVLVGEASTSKVKGKGARCWKRKKGKGTAVTATASTGGAPPAAPEGKGQREDTGCGAHICNDLQVLERSRRLSKDEMILRLGDGKAVAAEAVRSPRLVVSNHIRFDLKDCYFVPINGLYILQQSNLIMTAQHKRKVDNHGNAQIWHARLGHISEDRIRSIPARGGFSYFITFIDDHSRYGYVYLMRYKSEAFKRFKEYRLEWTPPRTPQLNGVAERRNRTLLDMVWSIMSFTELPPSFWGYALETAAKLLNIAPSKSVPRRHMRYGMANLCPTSLSDIRKKLRDTISMIRSSKKIFVSRNAVFLKKGFLSDSRHDEVLIDESSGEPQHDSTTSFEPTVHIDGVPVLRRSTRESQIPKRYGFMGLTSQFG
ncbi:UNVERIFIED_CONTAM: hypothetical protein Slati_4219400, partial [Sesamum latifolium]